MRQPVTTAKADPLVWAYVTGLGIDLRRVVPQPDGSVIVHNGAVR